MAFSANVIEVQEATFESDVIQKSFEKPVVVDFWAAWCGPCRMLGPILEKLANEPSSEFILAKVDVDSNPGLSMRYGVQGIPAVKAFRDGEIAGEFVGAQPEPMVRDFLKGIAPSKADLSFNAAEEMLINRRWNDAEAIYRELLEQDSTNTIVKLGLARSLIGQGQSMEAKSILEELLEDSASYAQAERLIPVADYVSLMDEQENNSVELTVVEAQYRQAARLLGQGKVAPAMDGLLEVLRYNKNYRSGQAKVVMLGIFELLGEEDPLTNAYRREMASVLF